MTRIDLDCALESMTETLPTPAMAEALRLADATMPSRIRRGRAPRARWVLPVLVGGAIALTAGAGTATVAISHWAGVSMPLENVRNTQPIPVNWTTEAGHEESCRAWIELRNPQPGDRATLDAAIAARDWSGLGQRLYDEGLAVSGDRDGESRVAEGLTPELQAFAQETFPGIAWFGEHVTADGRAVDATGFTCISETP
ncbi:hypothetical protein [Microbacterium sulfonylureivorans]|uniref:hypothetical protein n=1 Tax=Microbacterium sulfonylureivorans TaxID=2486854 RepID=UPI000FDC318D|nr:hypothetical protein [Microbacterium sulfonylureivorans]